MNANKIEVRFTEAAEPKNSTYVRSLLVNLSSARST